MLIEIIKDDITQLKVDAIVNAANSSLLGGGGVDGAIHRAGGQVILDECIEIRNKQGGCPIGQAVITSAGNMPARFVIHTVGPVWNGGNAREAEKLKNCYLNSIRLAEKNGVKTLAFPNISTGIYGYPKEEAAQVAKNAVRNVKDCKLEKITFVCFDEENYQLYIKIFQGK